jgi:hypothetical protein
MSTSNDSTLNVADLCLGADVATVTQHGTKVVWKIIGAEAMSRGLLLTLERGDAHMTYRTQEWATKCLRA